MFGKSLAAYRRVLDFVNGPNTLPCLREVDLWVPGVLVLVTDIVPEAILRSWWATEELSFQPTFGHLMMNRDNAFAQKITHFRFVLSPATVS